MSYDLLKINSRERHHFYQLMRLLFHLRAISYDTFDKVLYSDP